VLGHVPAAGAPGDGATEEAFGIPGDRNPRLLGVGAEALDAGGARRGSGGVSGLGSQLDIGDLADDKDLVTVPGDGRGAGEKPLGKPAGEPALQFLIGERGGRGRFGLVVEALVFESHELHNYRTS
jgi:hypothetical protein